MDSGKRQKANYLEYLHSSIEEDKTFCCWRPNGRVLELMITYYHYHFLISFNILFVLTILFIKFICCEQCFK